MSLHVSPKEQKKVCLYMLGWLMEHIIGLFFEHFSFSLHLQEFPETSFLLFLLFLFFEKIFSKLCICFMILVPQFQKGCVNFYWVYIHNKMKVCLIN